MQCNKMPLGKRTKIAGNLARKRFRGSSYTRPTGAAIRRSRATVRRIGLARLTPSRNCHSFKRFATVTNVDVAAAEYDFAESFTFGAITGAAEFAALYDRYMLTRVVLRIRILNNPNAIFKTNDSTAYSGTNWYPRLFSCPDYDDNTVETVTQLKERAKTQFRVLKPNTYLKYVIKPAVSIQTYRTALAAGYAPKWNQWIDMNQTDVPHYGMKFALDCSGLDPADTIPFKLEIERQYFFKCKDVR